MGVSFGNTNNYAKNYALPLEMQALASTALWAVVRADVPYGANRVLHNKRRVVVGVIVGVIVVKLNLI